MAKYKGVTQQEDGSWVYRLKIKLPSGKVVDTRIKKAPDGSKFLTARAAADAKAQHELKLINADKYGEQTELAEKTLAEVYQYFKENESQKKAPATLRKQESMWKNYIQSQFGDKEVNSITIIDLNTFLYDLYNNQNKSYAYVEGFLKFFYLLFGVASRMEVIDQKKYVRMFEMTGTKLKMPDRKQSDPDEDDVRIFTDYELKCIEEIFKSEEGNLLTAFYLGLYCGLRISETFALRWSDIDWDKGILRVQRQMHYHDGVIVLTKVKTLASKRDVLIPKFLMDHLDGHFQYQRAYCSAYGRAYRNTESVKDELVDNLSDQWIVGGDFINRKKNGELLTVNSMKYWSKKISSALGITFKYHYLRHTFASKCATQNVNLQMLMTMMGHKKVDTTRKYYISTNQEDLYKATLKIMNQMYDFRSALPPKVVDPNIIITIDGVGRETGYRRGPTRSESEPDIDSLARIELRREREQELKNQQTVSIPQKSTSQKKRNPAPPKKVEDKDQKSKTKPERIKPYKGN